MHKLGIRGNFALSSPLQSALEEAGFKVEHSGKDQYLITPDGTDAKLDALCPRSIEREGDVFTLAGLRQFAEFLHQPIHVLTRPSVAEQTASFGQSIKKGVQGFILREEEGHKARTDIHRVLRFAMNGSVEIPPDTEENLEKETAECHAKTEQAMRDADTWRSEREFGNPEVKISALPGTRIDSSKGFFVPINPELSDVDGFHGRYQKSLAKAFLSHLDVAAQGNIKREEGGIYLSGVELEALCNGLQNEPLSELIDGAEFEEAVQEKLISVQGRAQDFSQITRLAGVTGQHDLSLVKMAQLGSALTPLISSSTMDLAWTRANFMERADSPMENLTKDLAVYAAVTDTYLKRGDVSAAELHAIDSEFHALLSFTNHISDALAAGLSRKKDDPVAQAIKASLAYLQDEMRTASPSGAALPAHFLSEDQEGALDALKSFAGKEQTIFESTKSAVAAPVVAMGGTIAEFTGDVVNFVVEDPRIALSFVALAALLIHTSGGNSQAAQECTAMILNAMGEFEEIKIECTQTLQDLFNAQGFHWDVKFSPISGYQLYKHFANSNFIVGPTQATMEFMRGEVHNVYSMLGLPVNYDSRFDEAASAVVKPMADQLFAVNMFQNFSHAAFWMWAFSRGSRHGLHGFSKLFELAGPVVNLAYSAGVTVKDGVNDRILAPMSSLIERTGIKLPKALDFQKTATLSDRLMAENVNGQVSEFKPIITYKGDLVPAPVQAYLVADAAAQTADLRDQIAGKLPENLQEITGILNIDPIKGERKRDSLKRQFTIGAHNAGQVVDTLEKLDLFMQHTCKHVVPEDGAHIDHVVDNIHQVNDALKDYIRTGEIALAQTVLEDRLAYVAASEYRYQDQSTTLYENLTGEKPDAWTEKRLARAGNANAGREKRQTRVEELRDIRAGNGDEQLSFTGHMLAKLNIGGVLLWDGIVKSAHMARRGADYTFTKRNVAVAGCVAAVCTGMDLSMPTNEVVGGVSAVVGGTMSATALTAFFVNFNFWEDIMAVHIGTGVGLLVAGAGAGIAYRNAARPLIGSALETAPGRGLKTAFSVMGQHVEAGADYLVSKAVGENTTLRQSYQDAKSYAHHKNRQWGERMTERLAAANDIDISMS